MSSIEYAAEWERVFDVLKKRGAVKVVQEIETMREEYMERMAERDLQSSIRLQNMFLFTKFRLVDGVR